MQLVSAVKTALGSSVVALAIPIVILALGAPVVLTIRLALAAAGLL